MTGVNNQNSFYILLNDPVDNDIQCIVDAMFSNTSPLSSQQEFISETDENTGSFVQQLQKMGVTCHFLRSVNVMASQCCCSHQQLCKQ